MQNGRTCHQCGKVKPGEEMPSEKFFCSLDCFQEYTEDSNLPEYEYDEIDEYNDIRVS